MTTEDPSHRDPRDDEPRDGRPSAIGWQLSVDAVDAHAAADFWAEALHLDVGADRREAEVARLVELGGRVLAHVHDETDQFTVMSDPEGNEFCVQ